MFLSHGTLFLLPVRTIAGGARRLGNMKRLLRSQVYCLLATSSGLYVFFTEYHSFPLDLLHHWGPYHCYLFEAACGHWVFSLIEDYLVGEEVIAHIIPLPDEREELYGWMLNGLLAHHVVTVFAYAWCLATHKLSGLCVFGLMFEAPILLLNLRDLWACFEKEFLYPLRGRDRRQVSMLTGSMYFLWHLFRSLPCCLYPVSVLIWRPQLNTLSVACRGVYHFLGLLFCYVNIELILGIIPRTVLDDWMRAGLFTKEGHLHNVRVMAGEIDESGRELKKKKKKVDEAYVVDVENQQKAARAGLQMLGREAVRAHGSAEDCWVVIDGNVYDLTSFSSSHPGGSQVIVSAAGGDCSREFMAAGHSMKARKMMTKYMVGHILGRAYEQKNDVPVDPGMRGNLSEPFEMGRDYITYDNTSMVTVCLAALAVLFLQHAMYQLAVPKGDHNISLFYGNLSSAKSPILSLLALSLLFSFVTHKLSFYAARTMEGQLGNTAPLRLRACLSLVADWRSHLSALGFLLYLLADYVVLSIKYGHALRALRVSVLLTCALEVSWRTCLGQVSVPRTTVFFKVLLTATPVLCLLAAAGLDLACTCGVISRAYQHHAPDDSEGGAGVRYAVHAGVFAVSISASAVARFLFVRSLQPPRNEKLDYNMTFSRLLLTLGYAAGVFLCLPADLFSGHEVQTVGTLGVSLGVTGVVLRAACAAGMHVFYSSLSKLVSSSSCSFASALYCVWVVLILWLCAASVGAARYACFGLFFVALKGLSFEADVTLELQGADAPDWIYQAKQVENVVRHNISLMLHSLVNVPLTGLVSWISPQSQVPCPRARRSFGAPLTLPPLCLLQMYFTYPGPVMDLGPNCEYGECASERVASLALSVHRESCVSASATSPLRHVLPNQSQPAAETRNVSDERGVHRRPARGLHAHRHGHQEDDAGAGRR